MTAPLRILVAGNVDGHLAQLYNRVEAAQKKAGNFTALFCAGSFFSDRVGASTEWSPFLSGSAKAPIPTYLLGPTRIGESNYFQDGVDTGAELCDNVFFLGRSGIFTTADGLTVAYLSGRFDPHEYAKEGGVGQTPHQYRKKDVELLLAYTRLDSYRGVDVLLTSEWPDRICDGAAQPEGCTNAWSKPVALLCMALKPRYHFCPGGNGFYERIPYRNHSELQEKAQHVTRFFGIANIMTPTKAKSLYAFNVQPLKTLDPAVLLAQPPSSSDCPFQSANAKSRMQEVDPAQPAGQNFFFNASSSGHQQHAHEGRKRKYDGDSGGKRPPPKATGPCWFCLAGPEVEKHLVVSVGTESYIAMAKGWLNEQHLLVLPIGHYPNSVDMPLETSEEINKYKESLVDYFTSRGESFVAFERNVRSQHMQLQVVGIPGHPSVDHVRQALVKVSAAAGVKFEELPANEPLPVADGSSEFFVFELADGSKLFHLVKSRFHLQFGREVFAAKELLNLPARMDWRACSSTKEEETDVTQAVRTAFEPYDFTLKL